MRLCALVRPRAASGLPRLARVGVATAVGLALWLAGALLAAPESEAQGLFQSLFGGSTPPPPQPQPIAPTTRAPGAAIPFRGAGELGRLTPPRSTPGTDTGEAPAQGGATYRTVCVRLCDGFFFPVSSATSRRGFYRDAGLCRSRCGDEGRLFYAPAPGVEIAQMRDLTGRSYPALSNAFLYRKRYVPSCRCRPEPWSAAEIMRHARYAATEEAERPRRPLVGLIVTARPAAVIASATVAPLDQPTRRPAAEPIEPRDGPGDGDGLLPRPGLTTGGVAKADVAAPPAQDTPVAPAKPIQTARKPAREKDKVAEAAKKPRQPAQPPRPTPARQPAVAGAPRQVWPGDRPG